jgi:hypothetical protein
MHAAAMQTNFAAWMVAAGLHLFPRLTILMASPPHPNAVRLTALRRAPVRTRRSASHALLYLLRLEARNAALRQNRGQGIETANKRADAG